MSIIKQSPSWHKFLIIGFIVFCATTTDMVANGFTLKNTTSDPVLVEVTSTWCDVWGDFGDFAEGAAVAAGYLTPIGIATTIGAAAAAIEKQEIPLKTRKCTKGGQITDRHTINPNDTLNIGKLGVWYDIKLITPEGTVINTADHLRMQGKQAELYRSLHIPADETWDLKIINLHALGYRK